MWGHLLCSMMTLVTPQHFGFLCWVCRYQCWNTPLNSITQHLLVFLGLKNPHTKVEVNSLSEKDQCTQCLQMASEHAQSCRKPLLFHDGWLSASWMDASLWVTPCFGYRNTQLTEISLLGVLAQPGWHFLPFPMPTGKSVREEALSFHLFPHC